MRGEKEKICPRCGVRPRVARSAYCAECRRAYLREFAQKRRKQAEKFAALAEKCRATLKAMRERRRWHEENFRRVDMLNAAGQVMAACDARGYDAEMVLALARVLPKIRMAERNPGVPSSVRPVYRGSGQQTTKIKR